MVHPTALADMFRTGEIARDEYWRRMQDWHVLLRDYSMMISRGSMVDAVEITESDLIIRLRGGARFYWEPEDVRTPPSVAINNGNYEEDVLALLTRLAGKARVVLDIGANVGWFSVQLGEVLAAQGGSLVAFEPLPPTFERLSRNVELNGLAETVSVVNAGLGEADDAVCFYLPEGTGSVAASRRKLYPSDEHVEFECSIRTLDGIVDEMALDNIDLIKCDVEGAELFALRGGRQTLATHRPVVMTEMLRKWAAVYEYHPNDILALMAGLGYRCFSVDGSDVAPVTEVDENTTATNYLFIPIGAPDNPVAREALEFAEGR